MKVNGLPVGDGYLRSGAIPPRPPPLPLGDVLPSKDNLSLS